MSNSKNRDVAIDFVKIIATLMVMNSHMALCYGAHSDFATGGGIGDALFFFVSGFTLFLGRKADFINWYKRRLGRIYPTVLAMALVAAFIFGAKDTFVDVITTKRYWFIQAILINYIFLYPVIKYDLNLKVCITAATAITVVCFFAFYDRSTIFYGSNALFRWIVYYVIMLIGGYVAKNTSKIQHHCYALPSLLICVIAWYGCLYMFGKGNLQLASLIPLVGICYFTYVIGKSRIVQSLFAKKICGNIMFIVGNLCLESYLIQKFIFTDALNGLFPFNIPLIMIAVLIAAYLLHIISGMISQTFDSKPFDWKALLLYKK